VDRPRELDTRRPGDMPVGCCRCGAVYAYDASGRNLGSAFIEALVFACNMDWDLAWNLLPEEDYLDQLVENYDDKSHLVVPGGFYEGRRIAGALYFVRLHEDIREVTHGGVRQRLARAKPAALEAQPREAPEVKLTKDQVEKLVRDYQTEPLLAAAGRDKRLLRHLQRLLYTGDELLRLRAAEMIGKVSGIVARQNPDAVSRLLQHLCTAVTDSAASSWGAVDAIGEIISNAPGVFAGYIPALYQFLEDDMLRPRALRALGRAAQSRPDLIRQAVYFIPFLYDEQPETRGYAAWLLGNLGSREAKEGLAGLREQTAEVITYANGSIKRKTVGQLAREALEKICS